MARQKPGDYDGDLSRISDEGEIDIANAPARSGGGQPPKPPLQPPGGGGTFDDMEPRVAKLEAAVEHIQRDIGDIKSDIRSLRDNARSDFQALRDHARSDFHILFGAIIAVALGLAGIMARGFHWL